MTRKPLSIITTAAIDAWSYLAFETPKSQLSFQW